MDIGMALHTSCAYISEFQTIDFHMATVALNLQVGTGKREGRSLVVIHCIQGRLESLHLVAFRTILPAPAR